MLLQPAWLAIVEEALEHLVAAVKHAEVLTRLGICFCDLYAIPHMVCDTYKQPRCIRVTGALLCVALLPPLCRCSMVGTLRRQKVPLLFGSSCWTAAAGARANNNHRQQMQQLKQMPVSESTAAAWCGTDTRSRGLYERLERQALACTAHCSSVWKCVQGD